MSIHTELSKKAGPVHYVMLGLALMGLILLHNRVSGAGTQSAQSQAGFDITSIIVLGA